ncbi:hypothetical protein PHYC_03480 [Phycisphaerales bacterium]|nr:hypothetical protein PHYC_03480 [Phycisphaerales bacterium]
MKARRSRRPAVLRLPPSYDPGEPQSTLTEAKSHMHAVSLRIGVACAGHTMAEIAKRTGWEAETVRRYLRRGHRPSVDFVAAVAERFAVSVRWLILGEGLMDRERSDTPVPRQPTEMDGLLETLESHVNGLEKQVGGFSNRSRSRRGK